MGSLMEDTPALPEVVDSSFSKEIPMGFLCQPHWWCQRLVGYKLRSVLSHEFLQKDDGLVPPGTII